MSAFVQSCACGHNLGFNPATAGVGYRTTCPVCGLRWTVVDDDGYPLLQSERDKGFPKESAA